MKVAIIGGGASGLFCAGQLSKNTQVVLFEKNATLGKKLLLTGNGRCNVTNLKTPQNFLANVPTGAKFLTSALNSFAPSNMVALLNQNGVELVEEEDNKQFPKTGKATTILEFLKNRMQGNVSVLTNTAVTQITKTGQGFLVQYGDNQSQAFNAVVVATGGKSYPGTGSTGDGYQFAQSLGHTVMPTRQSLCGLLTNTEVFQPCAGVSFVATASVMNPQNKVVCSQNGNVLLTHFGVSGPAIHKLTAKFAGQSIANHVLALDVLPNTSTEELQQQINTFANLNPKREIFAFVEPLLVNRFAQTLKQTYGDLLTTPCSSLTKQKRLQLTALLKNYKTPIYDFDDYNRTIVTRGGVNTQEVNPKTMESKLQPNLYFLGEVLNLDALTGGYNLQIAFSTAHACAEALNEKNI